MTRDIRYHVGITKIGGKRDAQPAQVGIQIRSPILRLSTGGIGVTIIITADHIEHAYGVPDIAGNRADMRQGWFLSRWPLWRPAECGLETEHTGKRRRNAN